MIQKVPKTSDINKLLETYFPNYRENHDPFENIAVYTNDQIIGIIVYSIIYERSEINYILVKPEYRQQGIGLKLLNFAIEDSKNNHCESISLEVNKTNQPAINLYSQTDFKIKAIRSNYYQGEDAYLMVKDLR